MVAHLGGTVKVDAEIGNVGAASKARLKASMSCHAARHRIYVNSPIILARIRQIGEIQKDQRTRFIVRWKLKPNEGRMVSHRHVHMNARLHRKPKVTRACLNRIGNIIRLPLFLRVYTAIDIIVVTFHVGEQRIVSEGRLASGSRIMQTRKSGDTAAIVREASLVARRVCIRYSFCHAIRQRGACENIS